MCVRVITTFAVISGFLAGCFIGGCESGAGSKELAMLEGLGTDFVNAQGDTRLAQMWTLIHFGDYFAYYLAMLYGANPTPVDAIEGLKVRMKNA